MTTDGTPIGGWVLRADPGGFDVADTLARYGQVFHFPLVANDRTGLMEPGQACYLFSGDRSRVVGIWGVGEVVAPVLALADDDVLAEVEILALAKPIGVDRLTADPTLARSELLTDPAGPNPVVLRPDERRALEAFEFEIVEPDDEQRRLVDRALAEFDDEG